MLPQNSYRSLLHCHKGARQRILFEAPNSRLSPTVRHLWGRPNQPSFEKRGYTPTEEESARDEILGMAFKGRQPAALLMRCKTFALPRRKALIC